MSRFVGMPDDELAALGRNGDPEAMAALFERHADSLRAYATRWMPPLVRRKVSVADMLQETRIVAVREAASFEYRGNGSARNWLLKILQNKVRHTIRGLAGTSKRAVDREITQGSHGHATPCRHDDPTPSEAAIASELADLVEEILQELPAHHAQVLRMARFDGMTLGEIAACTGRSREAVKKTYARALSAFTRAFDRRRPDGDA